MILERFSCLRVPDFQAHFDSSGNKTKQSRNILTEFVRREAIFTESLHCQLSYMPAFEDCAVLFVDVHTTDSLKGMILVDYLAGSSGATYIRYITFRKIMVKLWVAFCLLVKVGKDAPVTRTVGDRLVNDANVYLPSEVYFLFMIHATKASVRDGCKPSLSRNILLTDTSRPSLKSLTYGI